MNIFSKTACAAMFVAALAGCGGGGASSSPSAVPVAANAASDASTSTANLPPDDLSAISAVSQPAPNAVSSPASNATTDTESVAMQSVGPAHAPILEQLDGAIRSDQSGWSQLAHYMDYVITDQRSVRFAAAAGLKVGIYTDPIRIHGGDIQSWPEAAFAHSCSGQRVWVGDAGVNAFLGDPGSSALRDTWYGLQRGMMQNQYGSYPYSFVFSDDSANPGEIWNPDVYHYGSQWGPTATPIKCGYNKAQWYSDMRSLFANSPMKVIFNNDYNAEYFNYMSNNPNVAGGMCEGCFTSPYLGPDKIKVIGQTWLDQMQAGLADVVNRKIFVLSPDGQVNADALGYSYASYMLLYDQNYTLFRQNGIATNSGLQEPPTVQIVPTQPRVPTPSSINQLRWPTQVYAREYKACYIKGKLVGACAAVVNPDTVWHPWPYLVREYHHVLQMGGRGAANELGDNGWVGANGRHPGNGIPASGWAIVFN